MRFTPLCFSTILHCSCKGIRGERHSINSKEAILQKTLFVDGIKVEACSKYKCCWVKIAGTERKNQPSLIVLDSIAPTDSPTGQALCPFQVLDFNDLTPGEYIHDQLWLSYGVNITAIRRNSVAGFTPIDGVHVESGGGAMVFDTRKPTGKTGQSLCDPDDGDPDLGSPNIDCPGGGVGVGLGGSPTLADGSPNPHQNCQPLGNILVIQESDKSCPDDSWQGGWLQFDFRDPTEVLFAKFLDIDEGFIPIIEVWHGQAQTTIFEAEATGDNGLWNQSIALANVTKLRIEYQGSGSLAELAYRYCP
eukprot:scaffold24525_cov162-Cylindrotheca_fusiformis.AAC.2